MFSISKQRGGQLMDIGYRIRQLRMKKELTLEELASRCELSKGFLSQLERNLTSPSITTLQDIVEALGTTLAVFFQEEVEENPVFTAEDFFVDEKEKCITHWIVPNAQKNEMEPVLLELASQGESRQIEVHEGEEFGFVLSGKVKLVNLDAGKEYSVKKGQTFYIKGSFAHCLRNDSTQSARVLWICTPPIF